MAPINLYRSGTRRFERALVRLDRRARSSLDRRVDAGARRIVEAVRRDGDRALLDYVEKLDGFAVQSADALRLDGSSGGRRRRRPKIPADLEKSLEQAIRAVEAFHRPQVEDGYVLERGGVRLQERRLALRRVGLYVPGGRFPYPSTVIMSAVPARLAGVEEIVVTTPPKAYDESPVLRWILERVGVDEVWGMGGAHAVAALAYGTETIRPVDLIAGPGNAWVAAAKRFVSRDVGVDREAGPSEVVIVASADASAEFVAADLLAQAEHDPQAVAILATDDSDLALAVTENVAAQLGRLPDQAVAEESLQRYGSIFVTESIDDALQIAERVAPEHLQLMGTEAESLQDRVRCAGAVFVGERAPTVLGDYVAGPSHVLPTGGSARFASGLGVGDFTRRSHIVSVTPAASRRLAAAAQAIAQVEGLEAHARAAALRAPGAAGSAKRKRSRGSRSGS